MKGAWRSYVLGAALTGLVACGNPGGTTMPDASPQARCDPAAPFGRPTVLRSLNTGANEEQATLSSDELTLYFSRDGGPGKYDIYQATRASTMAAFGNAVAMMGVNSADEDREPRVTADGLTMFASTRTAITQPFRVAFATRASTNAAFGPLQPVPGVNGTASDSDPYISPDGRVLYFSSDRSGGYDLYRSTQTGGVFSAPELVPGAMLNTPFKELTPVLTEDQLHLYFASSRSGTMSIDMFHATRASVQDAFGAPVSVSELNGTQDDLPSWISADNCELYYTHFDPTLNLELYVAFRGQ